MSPAPIALFTYCRPEHTRRTLESLRANSLAASSDLIVFCDGAKTEKHEAGVAAVRKLVAKIRGFASVQIVERPRNLGLAASISDGVSQVCQQHGRVIVVEDDLILAPQFLTFLNRGLDEFEEHERIFQISGYMYPGDYGPPDAVLLPIVESWGWGTWQRAWSHFDPTLGGLPAIAADRELKQRFNVNGTYDYFSMAEQQLRGEIDSWAIRWYASVFMRNGLVLYPRQTLVQNGGLDGTGTHTHFEPHLIGPMWEPTTAVSKLRLPSKINLDGDALLKVERQLKKMRPGLAARGLHSLVQAIRRFQEGMRRWTAGQPQ